jgi:hypothetical protein
MNAVQLKDPKELAHVLKAPHPEAQRNGTCRGNQTVMQVNPNKDI